MSDLKGKVVVVDFWATWCGPCVGEMPNMKKLYAEYKPKGVEFIGVSLDQPESAGGLKALTSGPARLCEALGITRTHDDGKDLTSSNSDLWIASDRSRVGKIAHGPRVGITQAADWPLRFYLVGSPFVSGPKTKAKM